MKNILIIGAGDAGKLLKQDILKSYPDCHVVGFLDDRGSNEVGVLGSIDDCERVIKDNGVSEIVLAIPSADGNLVRRVLLSNMHNRIPVKIVPRNQRVIGRSEVRYSEVKDLMSEDFLGRPFVRNNVDRLKEYYRGKVILVTGGAGSIGSEIVHQLVDLEAERVVVYDNSEYLVFMLEQQLKELNQREKVDLLIGSILNSKKLDQLFRKVKPDIVFHAAAYKHVHLMQDNIDEAIINNVVGTKIVVDCAVRNGVGLFTFVSTDKVVNPTSIMGATKKLCEFYINSLSQTETKFNIVRFGNVINSNGSVLPLFERQISLHRYVTVTHKEMERFFMSIREAAQLVVESTAHGETDSIHVLNMGELINIYEVALCVIRSKNLLPDEDVEVRVTGLRGGEKLVEELYTSGEEQYLKANEDNRIFSLTKKEAPSFDINTVVANLEKAIGEGTEMEKLASTLYELFPSLSAHKSS